LVVEPELTVTVEMAAGPAHSKLVVRVAGEVDIQTSPVLDEQLQRVTADGAPSVVVDLSDVTFLDSTGLSVLIAGLKRCQEAGGTMRLASPRPNVRKVLEITGLTSVFQISEPGPEGDGSQAPR
jgi:anti-sigma B factor antagonist